MEWEITSLERRPETINWNLVQRQSEATAFLPTEINVDGNLEE